jgi:hypothetical protein
LLNVLKAGIDIFIAIRPAMSEILGKTVWRTSSHINESSDEDMGYIAPLRYTQEIQNTDNPVSFTNNSVSFTGWGDARPAPTDEGSGLSGALSIGENNQAESHNQQGEYVLRTPTKHARQPEPRIQVRFTTTTKISLSISPSHPPSHPNYASKRLINQLTCGRNYIRNRIEVVTDKKAYK